jgi:uncharacterized protein
MVKSRYLRVEVADTPDKQAQGLMFRRSLPDDNGMLFKFYSPQNLRFWGYNTYLPLAIAFISPENKIEEISYISPCSKKVVASGKKCVMAIEANHDFFSKNNIRVGDFIHISTEDDATYVEFKNN